jgi:linoleoyl-CoA desaturase
MAFTLDMVGGSSYVWFYKHNVLHHTYTNVAGLDDDIEKHPWARLSPHQPRTRWSRFQHLYMWILYGLIYFKWAFLDDFRFLIEGKIAGNPIPRPPARKLAALIFGKVFFFSWVFVVPMLFHPWWAVLAFYAVVSFIGSVIMSIVFQLAHCVGEADFPQPTEGTRSMAKEWAAHQVESSVDFSRHNRFLGWYLGGLNFQIEHHLFPHISHVHYPNISRIVEETAQKHSVRYFAHDTLFKALKSHARWLQRVGAA